MKFLLVIFFLLSCNLVSATQLSLVNPEIKLNLKTNEEICKTIKILSDNFAGKLYIQDFWAVENFRTISKYNLDSKELGIYTNYNKEFEIKTGETKEKEICFKAVNEGEFYGAYYISSEQKIGIGGWIYLNVSRNKDSALTGAVIGTNSSLTKGLIVLSFVLVIILIGMVYLNYKKRY